MPNSRASHEKTTFIPAPSPSLHWCVERSDRGRGFGIVMPHFYKNWTNEDPRRFIMNGIFWTAKLKVPAEGVKTTLPDLKEFQPVSVEYVPPPPKLKKAP